MPRAALIRRSLAPAALLAAAGVAAAHGLPGVAQGLAYMLPALLLLLALGLRRYPGEKQLLRLIAPGRSPRRRAPRTSAAALPRPRAQLPRGGRLIASSLAVRPPPGPAIAPLS